MLWFKSCNLPASSPYPVLHYVCVLLAGFLFVVVFYVGLPFDFTNDHLETLQYANQFSFRSLIALTLNPLTPGWFFMDKFVLLRPLTVLFFKFNERFFGVGAFSFTVVEAVCCGLITALIFHVIFQANRSRFYGWLGVVLFLSFPSLFFSTMSFPHMEYLNTFMRLTAVILFGYLTLRPLRTKAAFIGLCFLWYLFVLLAIKLRSGDKILPPFFIAFLVLSFRSVLNNVGRVKYAALLSLSLLMMVSVVPLPLAQAGADGIRQSRGADRKEIKIRTFRVQNLYQTVVHNPKGDFPFTTLSKDKPPLSLTESYGFFLGWVFWLSLIASAFLWRKLGKISHPDFVHPQIQFLRHFYKVFGLLTLCFAVMFGSDLATTDVRYLSFILTPSVPLFVYGLSLTESRLFSRNQEKDTGGKNLGLGIFRLAVLSCFLFTVATNFGFFLKYLGHFGGGMTWGFVKAVEAVYRDQYGTRPVGHELYLKSGNLFNKNLGIDWHDSWPENSKKMYEETILKGNPLYVLSQSAEVPKFPLSSLPGFSASASLIAQFNFLDAPPFAFRVLKAAKALRKKENKHQIYIYKITGVPVPPNSRAS